MKQAPSLTLYKSLIQRIGLTIAALLLIRCGCYVPLPSVKMDVFADIFAHNAVLQLFNLLTGGGLRHFSILALGVFPLTSAEALFDLMKLVVPVLEQLQRGDAAEKQRFRRIHMLSLLVLTPLVATPVGWLLLRSARTVRILETESLWPGIGWLTIGATMFVPVIMLMHRKGIGMEIHLITTMGILGEYAHQARQVLIALSFSDMWRPALLLLIVTVIYVAMAYPAQFGVSKIPVLYPERQGGGLVYKEHSTHIPIRLFTVLPIQHCLELLLWLVLLVGVFQSDGVCYPAGFGSRILAPEVAYPFCLLYLLIYPYFLRAITYSSVEMAEQMKRYGGFIPGVRAGKRTAAYIDRVNTRLTFVEMLILLSLLSFPAVASWLTGWPIGPTGLAIFMVCGSAFSIQQRLNALYQRCEQQKLDDLLARCMATQPRKAE